MVGRQAYVIAPIAARGLTDCLNQAHSSELTLNLNAPSLAPIHQRELRALPADFRGIPRLQARASAAPAQPG